MSWHWCRTHLSRNTVEVAALIYHICLCGDDGKESMQDGHRKRAELHRTENLLRNYNATNKAAGTEKEDRI